MQRCWSDSDSGKPKRLHNRGQPDERGQQRAGRERRQFDGWGIGLRTCQEALKTALDDGNNNKNFVQAQACAINYSAGQRCSL